MTTAAPWSTSSSDLDRLDAEVLEVAHDALVVDDLAEGMRRLAGGRRLLGLVDRLAHAVAEPGALRDADFLDHSHASIIARGPSAPLDRYGLCRPDVTTCGRALRLARRRVRAAADAGLP